ncbi:MAG: hypothetical protein WC393_00145 [Candidatus Nanoarchaeia archaeon]|jgi:hypothetical protein
MQCGICNNCRTKTVFKCKKCGLKFCLNCGDKQTMICALCEQSNKGIKK